jgi:hypothetical protein
LRNIAALNNYLLGNVTAVKQPQQSPPLLDFNQLNQNKSSLNNSLNNMDNNNNNNTSINHYHHINNNDFLLKKSTSNSNVNDFNSLKNSCSKCSNSYLDLLKDELTRRIDTQVARDLPFSSLDYSSRKFANTSRLVNEIGNQIAFNNTGKFDSLYNKILLNQRYSTVNNVDLLHSLRSRFLL